MGLSPIRLDVGGRFGGTDSPAFRAMTPFGKIPVLEDGATVLFESAAILRYLLTKTSGLHASSQADMWAEWCKHTLCRGFILDVFWAYYRTPEGQRDMETVMAALRTFEAHAAIAMTQRGAGEWMVADSLSLADIWLGHVLYRYFTLDLPRIAPEGLLGYYEQLCDRDAYRTHVMVDYSELKARMDF